MQGEPPSYIHYIRQKVGHQKIFVTYASVVLFDDRGRVLLQRRRDFAAWGLPGGVLEMGEAIQACARRELLEETGLTAGPLRLVGIYSEPAYDVLYPNGDQVQQYTICLSGLTSGGQDRVDGTENSAQGFFDPQDFPHAEIPTWYTAMLRDALNGGPPAFGAPVRTVAPVSQIETMRAHLEHAPYIGVGAGAAVVNGAGQVLVVRRSDEGGWSLPAGYSDLGENAAATAMREVREETGLEVAPEALLGVFSLHRPWIYPNGDQAYVVTSLFRSRVTGGELHADPAEVRDLRWVSLAELRGIGDHPVMRELNTLAAEALEGEVFVV